MRYYSTKRSSAYVDLKEAIFNGLAPDKGLYMPERIPSMPQYFFENIDSMSFREIAFQVADALFGEDVSEAILKEMVYDTLAFDAPLIKVKENIYALELFHGPTLAFKDYGARFMARLFNYFLRKENAQQNGNSLHKSVRILVATSGDTGSAVANGFLGVDGVQVYVLYPKNKVSKLQEKQFATLGKNIVSIAVDGTFDDCQALVKSAFGDSDLIREMFLTSANSINIARLLPQAFYYFYAYAQLKKMGKEAEMVVSIPSGNLGNLSAAVFAKKMGLPIKRFIAATNQNDVFCEYINTGKYNPRPSVATIANAMDVGTPSNFERILEMYDHSYPSILQEISAYRYDDSAIAETLKKVRSENNYLLDPHGACGLKALEDGLKIGECGVFAETAHPSKFQELVEEIICEPIELPKRLHYFVDREVQSIDMPADFNHLKEFLMNQPNK